MYGASDPLVFPPHFPPTTRWKKFFLGVRWLGPDLSFFKTLKRQQASRVQSQMDVWGSGKQREIAELLSQAFRQEVRWPASVFLPGASFQVMCHGPTFGTIDDLGSISAIKRLEKHYGIRIPNSFWAGREKSAFGEIVEALTGGWRSYEMVLRYAHLAPEKLSSVASRIERQPEAATLKVAPRGKNVAENATLSLRLVN